MSSFVSRRAVKVTVEDRPGEWIEIKPKLDIDAREALTEKISKVSADGTTTDIQLHPGRYLGAMLEVAVVGWQLLDDEGQAVPFEGRLIGQLDPEDPLVDQALQEIADRNPTLGTNRAPSGPKS